MIDTCGKSLPFKNISMGRPGELPSTQKSYPNVRKYSPPKCQIDPISGKPVIYIDQLLYRCLDPQNYLIPEEYSPGRKVRLRANACEVFSKNNCWPYALCAAECVAQEHDVSEKEQICEKLRPLFLKHSLSLEVAEEIANTMPDSAYYSLVRCYREIENGNWEAVSILLSKLSPAWKQDLVPAILKAKAFDVLVEIGKDFSDLEKQKVCKELISINSLESLHAAEQITDYSYGYFVQCWIALKEGRFDFVEKELVYFPDGDEKKNLQKALLEGRKTLKEAMDTCWEALKYARFDQVERKMKDFPEGIEKTRLQEALSRAKAKDEKCIHYAGIANYDEEDVSAQKSNRGPSKIFFLAACVCVIALGIFLQRGSLTIV